MSNQPTTYVSALIMRDVTGEQRDAIAAAVEQEAQTMATAIEVYLPANGDGKALDVAGDLLATVRRHELDWPGSDTHPLHLSIRGNMVVLLDAHAARALAAELILAAESIDPTTPEA